MRPAQFFGYIRTTALVVLRCLSRFFVIAQQAFVYWRNRIRLEHRFVPAQQAQASTNVELTNQQISTTELENCVQNNSEIQVGKHYLSQLSTGSKDIKTPHKRRSKLTSLFRRLSLRNFMEYCVIALNEASSSSCSNKFDLSSCDSPVWLLGRKYELPQDGGQLIDDIRSKLWITYRRNFPALDENTRYTTDRGFGCMIRCGQMVLANALLYKNLGRDWRWSPKGLETNPAVYTKVLKLFQDREECRYSIHRIVRTGQHEGKSVGEWFGPNTIAQALKRIAYSPNGSVDEEILISVDAALDNVVVTEEIKSRFKQKLSAKESPNDASGDSEAKADDVTAVDRLETDKPESSTSDTWVPGILFIQLRLGLTKINPLYFAALKKTFQFKSSLGIIGGRPNHALYLIGHTDDEIIYLDPHSTQQYVDFDEPAKANEQQGAFEQSTSQSLDSTYHCCCPEKMSIDRLDPSLALCFYFNTENEFDEWCNLSQELLIKSEQAPMFEVTKFRPTDWDVSLTMQTMASASGDNSKNRQSTSALSKQGKQRQEGESADSPVEHNSNSSDHDEEFEMLA